MIRITLATIAVVLVAATPGWADRPVRYRLDVQYDWSAQSHPDRFPADAHMSGLFGVTHAGRYVLFRDGNTAGSGLVLLAENGRDTILQAEWAEGQRRKRVGAPFAAPETDLLPGAVSVEFETTADVPFVSFAAMIAPSPDWFVGAASLSLRDGDLWRDSITVPLWAWDAGSDSGETYDAENAETQPRQSVRLLAVPQFLGEPALRPAGRATLTRLP